MGIRAQEALGFLMIFPLTPAVIVFVAMFLGVPFGVALALAAAWLVVVGIEFWRYVTEK
jgi:hypothetical protein